MSATVLADPTQAMTEHRRHLKAYASRVIIRGEPLRPEEEIDRELRLREFLALGESFGCTQKELVKLLYAGVLQRKRGCDCDSCRLRNAAAVSPAP
ncbi:MAG: hypothetical protein AAB528_04340 [Chloroflexota bacterium]